jgi:hypothetical protein
LGFAAATALSSFITPPGLDVARLENAFESGR